MQILVLGMHRAGTSTVARLLNMMGAYFAPEGVEMPMTADNPKGYWERVDVWKVNEWVFRAVKANWYKVSKFEVDKLADDVREQFLDKARPIVMRMDANRPWMLKDPRLCLLLPLWRPLLEVPVCVYVHRSPIQVAQSLQMRNGFPLHVGLALWEKYTVAALRASWDLPQTLVFHEQTMSRPVETAQGLYERLNALGVQGLRMPSEQEILAFIDPDLFHQKGDAALQEAFISTRQKELNEAISAGDLNTLTELTISAGAQAVLEEFEKGLRTDETLQQTHKDLDRLTTCHEKLINQSQETERQLGRQLSETKRALDDTQHQQRDLRDKLETQKQVLREYNLDIQKLQRWSEVLDNNSTALLASWRWKVGDKTIRMVERLLLRPKVPLAADRIRQILDEFRAWRKGKQERGKSGGNPRLITLKPTQPPVSTATCGIPDHLAYRPEQDLNAVRQAGVSIIILNRDGAPLLRDLFQSFAQRIRHRPVEFLVVDHASGDDSLAVLKEYSNRLPIEIFAFEENRSFAHSNNFAAGKARYEYLLFLNNDIVFDHEDVIERSLAALQDPKVGLVGVRLVYPDKHATYPGEVQHTGICFWEDAKHDFYRPYNLRHTYYQEVDKPAVRTPAITAALMSCRKTEFMAIGGFCEDYQYGYEDVDLCLNYRRRFGKLCIALNNTQAIHNESATQKQDHNKAVRERRLNNIAVLKQRFGYALHRTVQHDLVQAAREWTETPPVIGFAVTEAHDKATAGDYFTALELAAALRAEFGWKTSFLPRRNTAADGKDWYDLSDIDVLVVMVDAYDLSQIYDARPTLITIAWMRNWFERWAKKPWFDNYELFLCSSQKAADFIRDHYHKSVQVLRIGCNAERFAPASDPGEKSVDYCFTGSHWNERRDIEALDPRKLPYRFALYGEGWENHPQFRESWKGFLPYQQLPEVYRASKILIDDANHVTKPWGSVNSRVFDALAAGVLVITNSAQGAQEVFDGKLPTYQTGAELEKTLKYYLDNPVEREALTRELRETVLQKHTYVNRARQFQGILENLRTTTFRFALKVPAPNWDIVHEWGDYYFALALKRALVKRGHRVRIDLLPDWYGPQGFGDDVALVLRGLSEYNPQPGQLNLMWNISHPDKVCHEEYERYDHVFVASESYAEQLATVLDTPVSALLQCTDPELFYPDPDSKAPAHELLFMGNSRKQYRQIVKHAVQADLPLSVYGSLWQDLIPHRYRRSDHIPNAELRGYYSRCQILLNDHWPSMRKTGFISNRLFDACACGTLVISDRVEGIDELFGGAMLCYDDTPEGLKTLVENVAAEPQKYAALREQARQAVLSAHTFEHRAATIMNVVRKLDQMQTLLDRVTDDNRLANSRDLKRAVAG